MCEVPFATRKGRYMLLIRYYSLVIFFYIIEISVFFIASKYNPQLTVEINIISRIIMSLIAGYVFYKLIFQKKNSFLIKYIACLLLYPIITYIIFQRLIDSYLLNTIIAKLVLDAGYSYLALVFFSSRIFSEAY